MAYNRTVGTRTARTAHGTAEAMVQLALAQEGKRYVFGTEVDLSDPDPHAFDCSELVQWAARRAGGYMPDGSQNQRQWCHHHKTTLPVEQALRTRGALLFTDSHVAISLGDGRTIEAANTKSGVCMGHARGRGWKEAGLVFELDYGKEPTQASETGALPQQEEPSPPPRRRLASSRASTYRSGRGGWIGRRCGTRACSSPSSGRVMVCMRTRSSSPLGAEFAKDNQTSLQRTLKRHVGPTDLYMAHFLGPDAAARFLHARDSGQGGESAMAHFPKAAESNPGIFYADKAHLIPRSLDQVYSLLNAKIAPFAEAYARTR